jgi:hypothetical protein
LLQPSCKRRLQSSASTRSRYGHSYTSYHRFLVSNLKLLNILQLQAYLAIHSSIRNTLYLKEFSLKKNFLCYIHCVLYFYILLSHICSVTKYCECEKSDLEILTDLNIFSTPEYGNVVSGMLFFCLYVCLTSSQEVGWIVCIFSIKSLFILGQFPLNMNILLKK